MSLVDIIKSPSGGDFPCLTNISTSERQKHITNVRINSVKRMYDTDM